MANLFRNSWPLGWTPNSDELNGDPRGLLRADNLSWHVDGVLSLIRGTKKVSSGPLAEWASQLYSKILESGDQKRKYRYAVSGSNVLRNYGGANSETVFDLGVITGSGGTDYAAFGFGFGHIFIIYGNQKRKDNGTSQSDMGLPSNNPPGITVNAPPYVLLSPGGSFTVEDFTQWEAIENGTVFAATPTYVQIDSDADLHLAVAMRGLNNPMTVDATAFDGATGRDKPEDVFSIQVRIADSTRLVKVVVSCLLRDPTATSFTPDTTDFYQFEWNTGFNQGINQWTTLTCRRSDFIRTGTDDSLDWRNVRGVKVTFVDTEYSDQGYAFNGIKFIGGKTGPLEGQYTYIQVDVQNNGFFIEKSIPSTGSEVAHCFQSSVTISPTTVHPQANECWIYRAGGKIPTYYLIRKITGTNGFTPAPFTDSLTEDDMLRINLPMDNFQANLPDGIIGMECNWKGRNWYITYETLYPSYRDNPSSYDTRFKIENAGKGVEFNYFITRLNNDTMILATNVDFYEITGTAGVITQDEIEFFDITIKPLGIKTPSISRDFVVREGNLFYLAADGLRILSGSTNALFIESIDLLFRGFDRFGINPVKIKADLTERYYLGIAKGRFFFSTPLTNNRRALFVYVFDNKIWRLEDHGDTDSIAALFVEEDDTIIYSTASFGDKFIRVLDTGTLFDETNDINFYLLTPFDDNQQPRNRKDSYTLKVVADTGNDPITITLRGLTEATKTSEQNAVKEVTWVETFNGKSEKWYSIYNDIGLVKCYELRIEGTVSAFKLYNWSIDYDARPEQLSVLRIPPQNYGVAGRKRLQEIPFIIDTLGNEVTFTPILDGVTQPGSTHVINDKGLTNHLFLSDTTAFNVGALVTGLLFEFYELVQPKEIEILPDSIRYKFIPYTNLNNGSRKRFIQYAIVIDTRSSDVSMTPLIDGVAQPPQIINTSRKQTVVYTFDTFAIGTDIACTLSGVLPFEFYEINLSECINERLPPLASHLHIPYTNLNTSARKRISQFAFVIDTRGKSVKFTPMVDGVSAPSMTFTTNRKETVIYTYAIPTVGVDFGGLIESLSGVDDFEYYGPNLEESVYEKLPPKTKALEIGCTNYGIAAPKRIRTIPMVIDTFGYNVTYTPTVDGIQYPQATFNTNRKQTVLYYFGNESNSCGLGVPFGIDYCGTLQGQYDFEFYELLKPENVETLPVGKRFDQFGPIQFEKVGKIREIRIRMVATGTALEFCIYSSDYPILRGSVLTDPNHEKTYPISLPKGINPNIFRMEIWAQNVFHRFDSVVRVNIDGAQTENKWVKIK